MGDYKKSWILNNMAEDSNPNDGGENRVEFIRQMQARVRKASVEVINFIERSASSKAINVISYQIIKSATSTAANYRAACRARSQKEFYAKICIVVEEADETVFWLEILYESEVKVDKDAVISLGKEWREILKIMSSAKKKSKPDARIE